MTEDAATSSLEARLQATKGGVEQQHPFHLPQSLPKGVPRTCYDDVRPQFPESPCCFAAAAVYRKSQSSAVRAEAEAAPEGAHWAAAAARPPPAGSTSQA